MGGTDSTFLLDRGVRRKKKKKNKERRKRKLPDFLRVYIFSRYICEENFQLAHVLKLAHVAYLRLDSFHIRRKKELLIRFLHSSNSFV